ncbi:MAG: hypothetical protein F4207_09955 [Gemmatimonadetes bacterium]|nr:hypothetical protein [Gemmatimonadota bacterium]MYA76464.1 hypothetical protein [Gemmatimonadota bacterium]MYG16729.1 hypothetical protein [Gemmatimonadota bacterium]MYH19576.1 hypothetical protein [Gemmatimonadota bacterium]MYK99168.1 hypothetical protein [Gemmatimonadota bacterium]
MNIHLKTAAILLATLIIGMVCGALILGAFARDRLQPPPQVTRERFVERWVRMVRPDTEQMQRIREVVGEHEPGFREHYMRHRQEIQVLVDSLHRDLEPILTEEQLERIKRIREERERVLEFRRDGDREPRRGRPGPPGRNRAGERGRGDRTDSNRTEGRGSDDRAEERGNGGDH